MDELMNKIEETICYFLYYKSEFCLEYDLQIKELNILCEKLEKILKKIKISKILCHYQEILNYFLIIEGCGFIFLLFIWCLEFAAYETITDMCLSLFTAAIVYILIKIFSILASEINIRMTMKEYYAVMDDMDKYLDKMNEVQFKEEEKWQQ